MNVPFAQCVGIEYIQSVHLEALLLEKRYNELFPEILKKNEKLFSNYQLIPKISNKNDNFLNSKIIDYSQASMIYMNDLCFDLELRNNIYDNLSKMKKGSFVITSNNLPKILKNDFISLQKFKRLMSWGLGYIVISIRK